MDNSKETRRRRRSTDNRSDNRYASDYYNNASQPNWDEELHRHNYGLPSSGRTGRRRHDFQEWGNTNFTTTGFDRGYGRINDRRRDFENDHINSNPINEHRDNRGQGQGQPGREYDYNRFGMGDQGGTWNQRGDERYDFGESNQRPDGKHRGKGPKGFTRSDERIKEDINSRLTDDAYIDASEIEVVVENGEVTLTGSVGDRSSKRRAEDIAELVSGVSNVENRLRVK